MFRTGSSDPADAQPALRGRGVASRWREIKPAFAPAFRFCILVVHQETGSLKNPPDFTFVTFFQDYVVPVVGAFAATILDVVEFPDALFQLHAIDQALRCSFHW